jgi:hypothetical protein
MMEEHVLAKLHVLTLIAEVYGPETDALRVMSSTGASHVVLKWKYIRPLKPKVGPETVAVQVAAVVPGSSAVLTPTEARAMSSNFVMTEPH